MLVDQLPVAAEREVIAVSDDVSFGDAEALLGPRPTALAGGAASPAGDDVGKVVSSVLVEGQCVGRVAPELGLLEQRRTLVV